MDLSQSVINELAVAWMRLHRTAAQPHLEFMIRKMQHSDCDGAADYRRVLDAVRACQSAMGERDSAVLADSVAGSVAITASHLRGEG